ncbi:MAG: glycosyltransferase [Myxococcales bacterium]|nr:glycosyltransferase [Myxococcales bacterium]
MRVLLVIGLLGGGGAERQLALFVERAKDLVDLGGFIVNPGGVWDAHVRSHLSRVYDSNASNRAEKIASFGKVVLRDRPDVIHCWHTAPTIYPLLTWPLHRRPIISNIRGELTRNTDSGDVKLQSAARLLRLSTATVANGAHLFTDIERAGLVAPRQHVIPNGIAVPELPAPHDKSDGQPLKIVGIGTLKPLKNWAQLLRVTARVRAAGTPIEATIYGEGPARPELTALCEELGLNPQTTLPGFSSDIASDLRQYDLLMHTSHTEGQPNAVLEGLACGLPAVTSALPACEDLASQGDFVRTFPIDDDDGALAALKPWLGEAEVRQKAGAAGRAHVIGHFGVQTMAERYVDVYRSVLG